MTRTRDEVLQLLARNRDRIRSFGVRSLALFGSAVRNEATSASDLDFLVEFDRKTLAWGTIFVSCPWAWSQQPFIK